MFGHDIQEPVDPVLGCRLFDWRLVKCLDQSFDQPWRNTVADSDFTLPIKNGRIFQLLLGSLERGSATFKPFVRPGSISFLASVETQRAANDIVCPPSSPMEQFSMIA